MKSRVGLAERIAERSPAQLAELLQVEVVERLQVEAFGQITYKLTKAVRA